MDLHDPDPTVRTRAVQAVGQRRDERFVPDLIELLDDRDDAVRLVAAAVLSDLTGQDMGYSTYAPRAERLERIAAWQAWYEGTGAAGEAGR